jgi:hypothetical protein
MTENTPLHVAVVWSIDGPRLLTLARSRDQLLERVAGYVAARAPERLHPGDAARVGEHLERGDHESAASHYFDTVGERWDEEHLHLYVVAPGDALPGAREARWEPARDVASGRST